MIINESSTLKEKKLYLAILRVVRSFLKEPTNEIKDRLINNLCQTLHVYIKLYVPYSYDEGDSIEFKFFFYLSIGKISKNLLDFLI